MQGHVYILANASMPGLVKVGRTTRSVSARAQELFQTGVPLPFDVYHSVFTPDCAALERKVHEELDRFRVHEGREFFQIDADLAALALDLKHREAVTDWLDQYCPDTVPVIPEMVPNEGWVQQAAAELDEHPFVVVSALETMTVEELAPFVARWRAVVAERARERRRGLSVVGGAAECAGP